MGFPTTEFDPSFFALPLSCKYATSLALILSSLCYPLCQVTQRLPKNAFLSYNTSPIWLSVKSASSSVQTGTQEILCKVHIKLWVLNEHSNTDIMLAIIVSDSVKSSLKGLFLSNLTLKMYFCWCNLMQSVCSSENKDHSVVW